MLLSCYHILMIGSNDRSKALWLDGFTRLTSILTAKELSEFQEIMRDKEIRLRTDVYEILLQDAEAEEGS
jgi:hypothetical protein